jgi:hypothetical protein
MKLPESPMPKISSALRIPRPLLAGVLAALAAAALTQAHAQSAAPAPASSPAAPPGTPAVHRSKKTATPPPAKLDLHTPPLSHIYPSSELRYILAADDDSSADTAAEVSVKSNYVVRVPGAPGNQLQAIPWAVLHPTQAWRIFTPLVEQ